MEDHKNTPVDRAELIKRFGLAGLAGIIGPIVVSGEADADEQPFNLGYQTHGLGLQGGKATPLPTPADVIQASFVALVSDLKDVKKHLPSGTWTLITYSIGAFPGDLPDVQDGNDENGGSHKKHHLTVPLYVILGFPG